MSLLVINHMSQTARFLLFAPLFEIQQRLYNISLDRNSQYIVGCNCDIDT